MVTKAGQAEILRAAQRDEALQKQLNDSFSELVLGVFGVHTWLKYRDLCKISCNVGYQVLTTLSNLQTLGEEYTGIVQVNKYGTNLPSKYAQVIMILLDTFGQTIISKLVDDTVKYIQNLPDDHAMRPEARKQIIKAASVLKQALPYIQRVHKAVFYLNGQCYNFSKRAAGVRYALVRYWLRDRTSIPTFRILGWISVIHLILHSILSLFKLNKHYKNESLQKTEQCEAANIPSGEKCVLCLNQRVNTSATPCGHLFCWGCIIPWVQEQPFCPLCRQTVTPSRVVPLRNYSTSIKPC